LGKPCSGKSTLASKLSERLGCIHIGIPQILASALSGYRLITALKCDREEQESIKSKLSEENVEDVDGLKAKLDELELTMKDRAILIANLPRDELNTPETELPAEFMEAAEALLRGEAVSGEQLDRLFQVSLRQESYFKPAHSCPPACAHTTPGAPSEDY
jgi:hypothetical protein